jgi:hypothetical protein
MGQSDRLPSSLIEAAQQATERGRLWVLVTVDGDQCETLFGGGGGLTWGDVAQLLSYAAEAAKQNAEAMTAMERFASTPSVGDAVRDADARLIRFQSWAEDHDIDDLSPEERAAIWTWIEQGGVAPWDRVIPADPPQGQQPYPPQQPAKRPVDRA